MADKPTRTGRIPKPTMPARTGREIAESTRRITRDDLKVRAEPGVPGLPPRPIIPRPPAPAPPPVVTAPPAAPPVVPVAPADNPLASLPFPSAGDRIKADDFKKLSQSLMVVRDAWQLSGSLLGRTFAEAKQALTSQHYVIQRVMSVFGNEVANVADPSLDSRKVIQVVPIELGGTNVAVVVTEAVETRRTVPNLMNLTYAEASERLHGVMGDVTVPTSSVNAEQLVGLSLAQARAITGR